MQKKKAKTVPAAEVPAVVEFLDAQDAINAFKQENADIFEQLNALVERYNTALQQADQVCRTQQISSGPFDLYQFSTKYDAEKLFAAVGRDQFLQLGGKLENKVVYDVDRGRLEACIAQGKLTETIVEEVRKETPNFHKPSPLAVP
jgi:hypothetical protein